MYGCGKHEALTDARVCPICPRERRTGERRQPPGYLNLPFEAGLTFLSEHQYTGMLLLVVHAEQGKPKRLLIPNPGGW